MLPSSHQRSSGAASAVEYSATISLDRLEQSGWRAGAAKGPINCAGGASPDGHLLYTASQRRLSPQQTSSRLTQNRPLIFDLLLELIYCDNPLNRGLAHGEKFVGEVSL